MEIDKCGGVISSVKLRESAIKHGHNPKGSPDRLREVIREREFLRDFIEWLFDESGHITHITCQQVMDEWNEVDNSGESDS